MWHIFAFLIGHTVMDIWCSIESIDVATMRARAIYGDHGYAVECTDYPVAIGDRYENEKFYRNGTELSALTYPLAEIDNLKLTLSRQSSDIDSLVLAVTPTE